MFSFYIYAGDLNSVPHACTASTLSTEPSLAFLPNSCYSLDVEFSVVTSEAMTQREKLGHTTRIAL